MRFGLIVVFRRYRNEWVLTPAEVILAGFYEPATSDIAHAAKAHRETFSGRAPGARNAAGRALTGRAPSPREVISDAAASPETGDLVRAVAQIEAELRRAGFDLNGACT